MRVQSEIQKYATPESRWAGVGPYYAMFPVSFADRVITEYTSPGEWLLDPFAGRGTALFSAVTQGRFGLGVEINPVGWVYGRAKLNTAKKQDVEDRIQQIGRIAFRYRNQADGLPEFFRYCFTPRVNEFLCAARSILNWRHSKVDCTTMALILVDLHGKRENALSNQMRQTKSMSPQYAILWWKNQRLSPPQRDPVEFMLKKVAWRYAKGELHVDGGRLYLGDSRVLLGQLAGSRRAHDYKPAKLLLTSPPYSGVTNYFYDQWLRVWLLGGPPKPTSLGQECKGKFANRSQYVDMLGKVFDKSQSLLARDAVIYVRTDARKFTRDATIKVLQDVFPRKKLRHQKRSRPGFTQTSLFDAGAKSAGEVDLVLW